MTQDKPQAILISSSNCEAMIGASWNWVQRFARQHGVPTWRAGGRRFVSGTLLAQAIEQAASSAAPRTQADRVAQLKTEIEQELRRDS